MAQKKNVLVEKVVDVYDEMEIQDYIDLVEQKANVADLSCFLNNANDTTVQICFKEGHDVDALKKYNVGARYWYLLW
jgi:acylphosphatase